MTIAKRDPNRVPTLIGVSSVDLETLTLMRVNPANGALLIDIASVQTGLDLRYLKLDASNDPITGALTVQPATDTLTALVVNDKDANNILTVDSINNRVGIGVATPTNNLSFGNDAEKTVWIENSAETTVGRALTINAGSTIAGATTNVAGGNLILNSGLGKGTGASSIIFQTGRTLTTGATLQTLTTAMTILGSGNVGIGTTGPVSKLDVAGVTTAYNFISNVVTGTQPYACTSTTLNTNLNADLLDGLNDTAFPILAPAASTRNVIQPTGNFTNLTLRADAASSGYLLRLEDSTSGVIGGVNKLGNWGFGVAPAIVDTTKMYAVGTYDGSANANTMNAFFTITGASTKALSCLNFSAYATHSTGATSLLQGFFGFAKAQMTGDGTIASLYAGNATAYQESANTVTNLIGLFFGAQQNASTGNVATLEGARGAAIFSSTITTGSCFDARITCGAAGVATSVYGFYVFTPSITAGGAITTLEAFRTESVEITGVTNYYSFRSQNGIVKFNEAGSANGDVWIEGDTATNLFLTDASADSLFIGTTVAGNLAKFTPTEVNFNDGGLSTVDFRIESDAYDALWIDASENSIDIMHHASGLVAFYAVAPVVQQSHIADATDAATAITRINAILLALENYGLLKTS